ncbi:MAG: molybdopterin-binding protein [Clostridia bacterium]|nr:molybdopterin-binding protein [Clostridia bacterium]
MNKFDYSLACEGKVVSTNVSKNRCASKIPVGEIVITEKGVENDISPCIGDVQVSMLKKEDLISSSSNMDFNQGFFTENLTVEGFGNTCINLLDRFYCGEVEVDVARLGLKCSKNNDCIGTTDGIFLRVINGGAIKAGSPITHVPRCFNFKVISVCNKAYNGEYIDVSGLELKRILKERFQKTNRPTAIDYSLLPPCPQKLEEEINKAVIYGCDVIFTVGGTGIGPGDITVDIASGLCDKFIPGIMDHIRIKYGQANPHALLSRSIAGVVKNSLIYTLPGSRKAVGEYMNEIFATMEHLVYVINGLSH